MDEDTRSEWLSIAEAAVVWKVSKITVHRWIKQGRVPAYHLGPRKIRLRAADVGALPTPVHAASASGKDALMMVAGDMLVTTELTLPRMTEEQAAELREIMRRIDENAARIRARSGIHASSDPLIRQMRDDWSQHQMDVARESEEATRGHKTRADGRRRERGG